MALFRCETCGLEKTVDDKFIGKRVKCPNCGPDKEVVIAPDVGPLDGLAPRVAPPAEAQQSGFVHCTSCGLQKEVPGRLIGKSAKCPKCSAPVTVEPMPVEPEEPEQDEPESTAMGIGIDLDDGATEDYGEDFGEAETATEGMDLAEEDEAGESHAGPSLEIGSRSSSKDEKAALLQGHPLKNLFAGLVAGCVTFFFCMAYAGLLFASGPLAEHFPHGLSMALIAAVLVGLGAAFGSRIPFVISGPNAVTASVMYLMCQSILMRMPDAPSETVFSTFVLCMALAAIVLGLTFSRVGKSAAGVWIRFIPYPVVAGLLAAVGLILLKGGYASVTGRPLTMAELGSAPELYKLFTTTSSTAAPNLEIIISSLPAFALGLLLFFLLPRSRNILALFIALAATVAATYGAMLWHPGFMPDYIADNLLYEPFAQNQFWSIYSVPFFQQVDWQVVLAQAPYMAALAGLAIASVMLKVTNLELEKGREVELDNEYGALGMANFFAGVAGGMPGSISLNRSIGAKRMGAGGSLAGLVCALVCAAALWFSFLAVPFVPRFLPPALLVFMGLGLLKKWLVDIKSELTRVDDYVLLLGIFLFSAVFGLLLGMGIGLAIALMVMISRYGRVPVVKHTLSGENHRSNVDRAPSQLAILKGRGSQIYILRLQGFIFLGTTHDLMKRIRARVGDGEQPPVKFIMLDFTLVSGLDSSVAIAFTKLKQLAQEEMFTLIFTNVLFEVEQLLEDAGVTLNDPDGGAVTFMNLDYAMEWCENQLLEESGMLAVQEKTLPDLLEPIFPEPKYIPRLMEFVTQVRTKAGDPVFNQGDPSDSMYFIESGMVNVELSLGGNKILRLKKMGPGTVFGEMGLYTTAPRSAAIVADEDCVCYKLSTRDMEEMQKKDPHLVSAIHRFIVNLLSGRVAEANTKLRDLSQ